MNQPFRFSISIRRGPAIEAWMCEHVGELGVFAQRWFDVTPACGYDVRESKHKGHSTVCIADGAFAFVNAFEAHVNIGFFRGAETADTGGCWTVRAGSYVT